MAFVVKDCHIARYVFWFSFFWERARAQGTRTSQPLFSLNKLETMNYDPTFGDDLFAPVKTSESNKRSTSPTSDPEPKKHCSMIRFYRANDEYGELSNFWRHNTPLIYEGKTYATSEHLYQARKHLFKGCSPINKAYADVIRTASTPYKAKLLAKMQCLKRFPWQRELTATILHFEEQGVLTDPNFHSRSIETMREVITLKFEQDEHCREVLLGTVGFSLVEHTTRDTFWADGGDNGRGENHLGRLLAQLREELVEGNLN